MNSHKYINTIFLTYIQQHAMKFSNCLSKIYQHNFFDLYISTILTSNCLSQMYQHNFSDLYRIKSTSLSKMYQHKFSALYTIKSTSLSQIYQHNFFHPIYD